MIPIPKINPALTFKMMVIDTNIFNYPKWTLELPAVITEDIFNLAWSTLYGFHVNECEVKYGDSKVFNITIEDVLIVRTPTSAYLRPIDAHTEEPILAEDQTFYYPGRGCPWSTDLLGQRFYLIDPEAMLPFKWEEVYAWEVIKRYEPFMNNIMLE